MNKEETLSKMRLSLYAYKFWSVIGAFNAVNFYPNYLLMVLVYAFTIIIGFLLIRSSLLVGVREDLKNLVVINSLHKLEYYYNNGYNNKGNIIGIIMESFIVIGIVYGLLSL